MVAAVRKVLQRQLPFLESWDLERTRDSFRGARHKRYCDAYDSLLLQPLSHADARISAFVKAEKADPAAKVNPDPRMIQARQPRYNLVLASYLRPVEHYIYNLVAPSGIRMVAKGLNQKERAKTLIDKMARFSDPVVVSLDMSRFDKHVSATMLQQEHAFYLHALAGHPQLQQLLGWQVNNRCFTQNGVKYRVHGGRMSGDINTALGNVLLCIFMVIAAAQEILPDFEIFNDGDDVLLIFDCKHLLAVLESFPNLFKEFGQELKIENIAYHLSDVVFCQSHVVFDGIDYLFVRDWRKVLSHSCAGTKYWNDPHLVRPLMGLVGQCELALSAGVPVLQGFAEALIRLSGGKCAKSSHMEAGYRARLSYEGIDHTNARSRVITEEARESFALAFGTPIWEQHAIEDILLRWNPDLTTITVPQELDWRWIPNQSDLDFIPEIY